MMRTGYTRVPLSWRERLLGTLVVASLALPFIPVPGDRMAQMRAVRRDETTAQPIKVTTEVPRSVCRVLAFSLAYEDPDTGAYTRVRCKP